ncbi:MAG: hypothetical protein JWN14_2184, partial [Chthonomonadales bacterium]|nr:hypothetical protein [Chthonomonadales bacterium]
GLKPCARGCFATEILHAEVKDLGCPKGDYFSAKAGTLFSESRCTLVLMLLRAEHGTPKARSEG